MIKIKSKEIKFQPTQITIQVIFENTNIRYIVEKTRKKIEFVRKLAYLVLLKTVAIIPENYSSNHLNRMVKSPIGIQHSLINIFYATGE